MPPRLIGFHSTEEEMIKTALDALAEAGYDGDLFHELIRADMPKGYRAMSLENGAVLGVEAFVRQDCLNHVLEEELLHLMQKAKGLAKVFDPETALELELDANEQRKFPPACD
jgi:hypothetical protein